MKIFFIQTLKMDLTEGSETSAKQPDAGKIPKRKHTSKGVYVFPKAPDRLRGATQPTVLEQLGDLFRE
jgi:hypothetical protein